MISSFLSFLLFPSPFFAVFACICGVRGSVQESLFMCIHVEAIHQSEVSFWFSNLLFEAGSLTARSPEIRLYWLVSKALRSTFLRVPRPTQLHLALYRSMRKLRPSRLFSTHFYSVPRFTPFSRLNSFLLCKSTDSALFLSTISHQTTSFYFCITCLWLW